MQERALVERQLAKHGGTVSYFFLIAALILLDHTIKCQNGRHHAFQHARSPDVGQ
jgi:hypothetical protein